MIVTDPLLTGASHDDDALLHFDETAALVPLDATSGVEEGEVPETFPAGL